MASDAFASRDEDPFIVQARACLRLLDAVLIDSEQDGRWIRPLGCGPGGVACSGSQHELDGARELGKRGATTSEANLLESLCELRIHLRQVLRLYGSSFAIQVEVCEVESCQDLVTGPEREALAELEQTPQQALLTRSEALQRWRARVAECEAEQKVLKERCISLQRALETAQEAWQKERLEYQQQLAVNSQRFGNRKPLQKPPSPITSEKEALPSPEEAAIEQSTPQKAPAIVASAAGSDSTTTTMTSLDKLPPRIRTNNDPTHALDPVALLQQIRQLQKERDELMVALARAEEWLGRGSFDENRYRLWHPREAPPGLLTRTLQPPSTPVTTSDAREPSDHSQTDPWKLVQRTREAARTKILEVVESIYYLFGWRMRIAGATYSLESLYAEHADDKIQFQRNAQGGFELIATEYVQRALRTEIDTLLRKMDSIPAFLATVQLQLFEQSTAVIGTEAD
jgi:hypothetical protein